MKPKIKALIDQIESGKLKSNMSKIGHFIMTRGGSDIETMRSLLNIKHQSLTGAMSVMENHGVIYKNGTCKGGKFTWWMYESDEQNRTVRGEVLRLGKFIKTCERMKTDFPDFMSDTLSNEIKKITN